MRALLFSVLLLGSSGCLTAWNVGGPWACSDGGVCAEGLICDDGVCCKPDGTPRCPTLPFEGTCPFGSTPATYFRDDDGDGAGALATGRVFCSAPKKESWVADSTDCNDADDKIRPLATERCNAQDDDCDGEIDEGLVRQDWFRDVDGDGFGEDSLRLAACAQPQGYAARAGDCAPMDPDVFPGAPERCNDKDDNCNGQLNDAPFIDAESPSGLGETFPCTTAGLGECRPGHLVCLSDTMAPSCAPLRLPVNEVCGNGKDEDCSGAADDRPGCGGPQALLSTPGISFGAVEFYDTAPPTLPALPQRCMKREPGSKQMAWLNPSWIGNGSGLHVWFAEAPADRWWDLSGVATLRLPVTSSAVANTGVVWAQTTRFDNAVIHLCGKNEGDYLRLTPTAASQRFVIGPQTLQVPLAAGAAGWSQTRSATFKISEVRSIEMLVAPEETMANTLTFTNRFLTDAGVVGFQ